MFGSPLDRLESRQLLSFASPVNGGNFGPPSHSFNFFLDNDAGLPTATLNSTQLNPGGTTVHADLSGNIIGPPGLAFIPHTTELDILANGSLEAQVTEFQPSTDPSGRLVASFSTSINLPSGETLENPDRIDVVFKNTTLGLSTPSVHIFDITVDTVGPTIANLGTLGAPDGATPVTLSRAIDPSTFTPAALTLTRDGAKVVPLVGATVTEDGSSGTSFLIQGLGGDTSAPGNYALTVDASGFRDLVGNPGSGSRTTSFSFQAPSFTASSTTFTAGTANTFTVNAAGNPPPTLSESGTLPPGVSFDPSTGVLSGTPAPGTGGVHEVTFTASNGIGPPVTQDFALTVDEAPAITLPVPAVLFTRSAGALPITATGFPAPTLGESGTLPEGVKFDPTTGLLGGTPAPGSAGTYTLTFTASNGVGMAATQALVLDVVSRDTAPTITSPGNASFTTGEADLFRVTSSGSPTPMLSVSGTLPPGLTFADNGDATGVFTGTPAAGTGGVYNLSITAANGVGNPATQAFALTVDQPPAITSAGAATFVVGSARTFTVTVGGFPLPVLSESGVLPAGVTFDPRTGALAGTPAAGTARTYNLSFTASNGVGVGATQNFILTVAQPPAIASAAATTFVVGMPGSFSVTAGGSPPPALSAGGNLPPGVSFDPRTGTLAGTPAAGAAGTYNLTFTADNGVGVGATQNFVLTVVQAPMITSAAATTFIVGSAGTFTVTAAGSPPPTLSVSGILPAGITFNAANGTLTGTPALGTAGTYNLTFTAVNGVGTPATQKFALRINRPQGTGPTIVRLEPVSSPRTSPVSTVTVVLSEPTLPSTFTESNLTLTRDGVVVPLVGSTVTETPVPGTTRYIISGLDGLTVIPGKYVLTVDATGFRDQSGLAGVGSSSISFVVEPIAPPVITGVVGGRLIRLSFAVPLDQSRAESIANYTLLPILSGRQNGGPTIRILAAAYTPSTGSVMLTTNHRLKPNRSYLLEINGVPPGGLTNPSGTPLGGNTTLILTGRAEVQPSKPRHRSIAMGHIAPGRERHSK